MLPRLPRFLLAILVAAIFPANLTRAQHSLPPLRLASLEWLVAESDVVVRGTVVDVASEQSWNIITIDVAETLKGGEARRLQFAAYNFDGMRAALTGAKD